MFEDKIKTIQPVVFEIIWSGLTWFTDIVIQKLILPLRLKNSLRFALFLSGLCGCYLHFEQKPVYMNKIPPLRAEIN